MDKFLYQYAETALWASPVDDGEDCLDANYTPEDIDPEDLKRMEVDCQKFLEQAKDLLSQIPDLDLTDVAHDFYLTRNGHGAGFWDSPEKYGNQEIADALSDIAREFGESDLYAGDDGRVYLM